VSRRRLTVVAAAVCACATAAAAAADTAPKPAIAWKPIPFSARRKAETAAYAKWHYGVRTWRLRDPKVIVEHVTASPTFGSAFATFAADVPDAELHELPGTCAHFVIDTDGTIYQLVRLDVMCRHTVGLNWTAIGIEHVGTSDVDVLSNPRQMAASLALTAWLMSVYRIRLGDVIGHHESLTSRFHHERDPAWRCQTHADWKKEDMDVYRAQLKALVKRLGIPVGKPVERIVPRC
jgi:N-acetylmuramoyl-L-alanine amidase-like protein